MSKRQLTDIEKKVSTKNLVKMENDLEYIEQVMLPKKELALKTAPLEYKRQFQQLSQDKDEADKTLQFLKNNINILKDQIENGVDEIVKEKSSSDEE